MIILESSLNCVYLRTAIGWSAMTMSNRSAAAILLVSPFPHSSFNHVSNRHGYLRAPPTRTSVCLRSKSMRLCCATTDVAPATSGEDHERRATAKSDPSTVGEPGQMFREPKTIRPSCSGNFARLSHRILMIRTAACGTGDCHADWHRHVARQTRAAAVVGGDDVLAAFSRAQRPAWTQVTYKPTPWSSC